MLPTVQIPGSLALLGPLARMQASFLQPFTQFLGKSGGRGRDWSKGLWAQDALAGDWLMPRWEGWMGRAEWARGPGRGPMVFLANVQGGKPFREAFWSL